MYQLSRITRLFFCMRNQSYAEALAKTHRGFIRRSRSELLGITPLDGDCFWIDAHIDGSYCELNGINHAAEVQQNISAAKAMIIIYSWMPESWVLNKCSRHYNLRKANVIIKRFPA